MDKPDGREQRPVGMSWGSKWSRMAIIAAGYMASDAAYATPGPSLIDLEMRTSATSSDVSLLFFLRAVGALVGSLCCGFLVDLINIDIILAVVEAVAAILIVAGPWWLHVAGLSTFIGLTGVCCAIINIGAIFYCVALWGSVHPPYLLLLNFLHTAMAFSVSPTVHSLLLPKNSLQHPNGTSGSRPNASLPLEGGMWMAENTTANASAAYKFSAHDVKVQYAFLLPGVLFGIACIGHTLLVITTKCSLEPLFLQKDKSARGDSYVDTTRLTRWRRNLLLITFGVISANVGSIEEATSVHLFNFSTKYLDWTESVAASTEVILGGSTIVALITLIVLSLFVPSSVVMGILQFGMLTSAVVMCLSMASHLFVFHIGVILCGLSFGPAIATMVSWMSTVFGASGKLTSYYVIMVYIGRLSTGHSLNYLFDTHGPVWFVYMNMMMVGAATIAYVITIFITDIKSITHRNKSIEMQQDMTKIAMMSKLSAIMPATKCM